MEKVIKGTIFKSSDKKLNISDVRGSKINENMKIWKWSN